MRKAGGIIGLIAGIFGVLAALTTLGLGGMGSAFKADNASTVVGLGFGGLAFSFLVIILSAVAIGARGRTAGVLLIFSSIAGAILGGTLVAVCMVLALVGGILAAIGSGRAPAGASANNA